VKQFNIQVLWRADNGQAHDHQLPVSPCHNSFIISGLLGSRMDSKPSKPPHQQPLLLTRKWSTTFASTGHTQNAFWIFLDLLLFQNPAFHAHKQSLTQLLLNYNPLLDTSNHQRVNCPLQIIHCPIPHQTICA
jgi:hypothetical protein